MGTLKFLAVALVLCSVLGPVRVALQPSPQPPNMMDTLNKEAEASDPDGIHIYSQHLIQMLVVSNSAGPAYATSLSDRLARAEVMARQGKRKLISEADIAQAFNQLMKETGAPDSYKADVADVEELRGEFAKILPALFTREKNGSYCNPGEAVYVLELLIENVARPHTPIPENAPKMRLSIGKATVQEYLEVFFARHSVPENKTVLNHLFKVFQI
jgi:hypothetical protein